MKIVDLYSPFIRILEASSSSMDLRAILAADEKLLTLKLMAEDWGLDLENALRWMRSPEYAPRKQLALGFLSTAHKVAAHVEGIFKSELPGEIRLSPSLMRFDGFARYDSGYHTVWFGVDHPDADKQYLEALMSHELSHVFRDHQPGVWAHLGKPLEKIKRAEYLDNTTALEHLVSEGLATLFSQVAFPFIFTTIILMKK